MTRLFLLLIVGLVSACAILPGGKPASRSSVFLLETRVVVPGAEPGCQVVIVNSPIAAPGQIGVQMLYQRHPNQIERFAHSRWAASPDVMIEPLLLDVLRASGRFSAVLSSPAAVRADLRIENDDLWLVQKFEAQQSFIELRMSSRIYSPVQRRLLASQSFSYNEPAAEASPAAGVAAADHAVKRLLADYHAFVIEAASQLADDCLNRD